MGPEPTGVRVGGAPCLTHGLRGQHVVDRVIVLLGQNGQLPGLLLLQPLEHRLVVGLGSAFQQVVPEGFVLPGLDLTRLLELTLDLQLLGLRGETRVRRPRLLVYYYYNHYFWSSYYY